MDNIERVEPIRFTDNETGEQYELDFSRDSVRFMAERGFKVGDNIVDYIAKDGPELWFYAFRKNHKNVGRNKTDALYTKMGGLTPKVIERLALLYNQALMSNNIVQDDEELEKNSRVTVELL
jgi:hypothetical protein